MNLSTNYTGPYIGYYYKSYKTNLKGSLNYILLLNLKFKGNITCEKYGLYTIRKSNKLIKSYSLNDNSYETSYQFIHNNNINNNIYFEKIIFNSQTHFINFKLKILLNLHLELIPYPF